eukprot:2949029-Amphidinium_carterae.2
MHDTYGWSWAQHKHRVVLHAWKLQQVAMKELLQFPPERVFRMNAMNNLHKGEPVRSIQGEYGLATWRFMH